MRLIWIDMSEYFNNDALTCFKWRFQYQLLFSWLSAFLLVQPWNMFVSGLNTLHDKQYVRTMGLEVGIWGWHK